MLGIVADILQTDPAKATPKTIKTVQPTDNSIALPTKNIRDLKGKSRLLADLPIAPRREAPDPSQLARFLGFGESLRALEVFLA